MAAAAAVLLRHRRIIVGLAFIGGVAGTAVAVLRPIRFTSTFSFIPQAAGGQTPAAASGLAALTGAFGINLATSGGVMQSTDFFVELTRARPVLERLAMDTLHTPLFTGVLADRLGSARQTPDQRRDDAVDWLRETSIGVGVRRGVINVRVSAADAETAFQLASGLLRRIGEFNVSSNQTRAVAERRFLEARLDSARAELEKAETAMKTFLESNRKYENASILRFTNDRLQRDVTARQQLITALLQQYEQARVDEVRNLPVITVIDEPNLPAGRDSRHLVFALVSGIMLGAIVGTFGAFASGRQ